MSGQDGNRGYLIQAIIALLESLNQTDWSEVTIEADHISDKVDVAWSGHFGTRVCQVKSSINQISKPDAIKWAEELEGQSQAEEYLLILVGPCSSSVARMNKHKNVQVPCPKNLDFDGLLGHACHLLGVLLEKHHIDVHSFLHREAIANALVTKLSIFASSGKPFTRVNFTNLLLDWAGSFPSTTNFMWEQVDFSTQRGIENAIAGKRLGPSDVMHCPEFSMCKDIKIELERSHLYWIAGKEGCGKSITAWQVAKKFQNEGYLVWRPDYSAKPADLLKALPLNLPALLVIDDAQQYPREFIERLSEKTSPTLKTIFTSTLIDINVPNPVLISPMFAIEEIKNSILNRKKEILPIVQQFDRGISDSYMDTSFENRLEQCARQSSPWEFFWVLRGGWQTARKEFESIKQVPNANFFLTVIANKQISSCDAGIQRNALLAFSEKNGITDNEFELAISHLKSLGLVSISDDIFRTKHISFAHRLIGECFSNRNYKSWSTSIEIVLASILDHSVSLKGVYWLLNSIDLTDATGFERKKLWLSILEPLKKRCKEEWNESEWAIGCYYYIVRFFSISDAELCADKKLLLEWFTSGFGNAAIFSKNIANELINLGNDDKSSLSTCSVKSLFEQINYTRLVELANKMSLDDFYSFGELVNRVTYYSPEWSELFISKFDWLRTKNIIIQAGPEHRHSVDKLVANLSRLANSEQQNVDHKYVIDVIPYIVNAFSNDPINTIDSMGEIFWHCLGFGPHFLRYGKNPDENQLNIAKNILSNLKPSIIAKAMCNLVSRDLEVLARSLSIIDEIDETFISKMVPHLPHMEFNKAIYSDWQKQSSELQHLIRYFIGGESREPARSWISSNKNAISGALQPIFVGIAPEVAIEFFEEGKGLKLFDNNRRWSEAVFALASLADYDENVCVKIVKEQMNEIVNSLYRLSLDSPKHIVTFIRIIHSLSAKLFNELILSINLNDPQAIKTIQQLNRNQPKERRNYQKLARLTCMIGGDVASLGDALRLQLKET